MSRIHEALKKAEQDRQGVPGAAAEVTETLVSSSGAALGARPEMVTAQLIRERATRTAWAFDPRTMIFSNSQHGEQSHQPGSEEFRTLRSRLYQIRERQPLHSLLITSALPAEGKTFVAANLAHAITRQHERSVLLIDADLRLSRLHQSLGAPSRPGLTEVLTGEADLLDVIQRGPVDNFFFLPGGKPASNPAELLASERMKDLLKRVRPGFDWVILDSPPAVPVADASLLADLCDGVLIVVRSAVTPYDMAQRAVQEFKEKHLVGVVLNDVEPGKGYSSYYYHYYYGEARNGSRKG